MKNQGFTLIELMIVIAILAIIVAIAIPSYYSQVEKTRRADAQSALLDAAQQLERCFTRNNTYENCLSTPIDSPDEYYTITFAEGQPTATTYTLRATGVGAQSGDACSPFTLDHRGNRGDSGGSGDRCWGG